MYTHTVSIHHFIHCIVSARFMLQDRRRGKEMYWALAGLQKIEGAHKWLQNTQKRFCLLALYFES